MRLGVALVDGRWVESAVDMIDPFEKDGFTVKNRGVRRINSSQHLIIT